MIVESQTGSHDEHDDRRGPPRSSPRVFALSVAVVAAATLAPVLASDESAPPPRPVASDRAIVASDPGESGAQVGRSARTAARTPTTEEP